MTVPPPFSVKTGRLHGVDVTNTDVDFPEGQEISDVEIDVVKRPMLHATAAAASCLPARWAARTNPAMVLRAP